MVTGRWAGVPVTASEGTPAPLAATVEASPRFPSPAGEGEPSPGPSSAPDCDDRAVRLTLAAGAANLRLLLVRDALKDCCEPDRVRILGAIGRESK